MEATVLQVEPRTYPNGGTFYVVLAGKSVVGGFDKRSDGYVPFGCVKPLATMEQAAVQAVARRVTSLIREAAAFSELLDLPVSLPRPATQPLAGEGEGLRDKQSSGGIDGGSVR
jgi:hypothetical protein